MSTPATAGDKSSGSAKAGSLDVKREEFRKYLEKEGILECLTRALVRLYEEPEKPVNALDYLKNNFADRSAILNQLKTSQDEIEALKKKVASLESKIKALESEKAELSSNLKEFHQAKEAPSSSPKEELESAPDPVQTEAEGKVEPVAKDEIESVEEMEAAAEEMEVASKSVVVAPVEDMEVATKPEDASKELENPAATKDTTGVVD